MNHEDVEAPNVDGQAEYAAEEAAMTPQAEGNATGQNRSRSFRPKVRRALAVVEQLAAGIMDQITDFVL